jgi:hypothetical protein
MQGDSMAPGTSRPTRERDGLYNQSQGFALVLS